MRNRKDRRSHMQIQVPTTRDVPRTPHKQTNRQKVARTPFSPFLFLSRTEERKSIRRRTQPTPTHVQVQRRRSIKLSVITAGRSLGRCTLSRGARTSRLIYRARVYEDVEMSSCKSAKPPRKIAAKEPHEMTHAEKLRLIDDELNAFYKYCQQAGFTEEEMDIICQPLVAAMRRSWLQLVFQATLVLVAIGTLICLAAQLDFVGTHFSAIGRLLMIKVLPIWNWQPLYYENCMMNNPFYNDYAVTEEDCVACEALETIDRLSDVRYRQLVDNYLNRDAPAIITDAMNSWTAMNTDFFWFDNITHLYLENERLMETVPCALTSNLRTGSSDLAAFLRRVHSPGVAKWFVHWQNCDINAVKVLRKYYQRPYFLSSTVSPAHFNWVLMSSDYNSPNYKRVELDSGLIALAQLRGATQLKLTPINPCNSSCPELIADLHQGEMLVFTNLMWNLEYAPMRGLDNIAILTETVWEEDT